MSTLRAHIDEKSRAFRARFIGRTLSAVTIERDPQSGPSGVTAAVTDNFLKLTLSSENGESIPANRLITARISALSADGVCGIAESGS